MKYLLEHGTKVHSTFGKSGKLNGNTALRVAAENGHDDIVQILREYGAVSEDSAPGEP